MAYGEGRPHEAGPEGTFRYVLNECLTQVETYVHVAFPKEQVLWIHDRGRYDDHAKEDLKDLKFQIDKGSWEVKKLLFKDNPYPDKSHIVDTIYFGKSEESRAIQLADVCCSTITRHLRGDPVAIPYYQLLRRQIISGDKRPVFEDIEKVTSELLKSTKK